MNSLGSSLHSVYVWSKDALPAPVSSVFAGFLVRPCDKVCSFIRSLVPFSGRDYLRQQLDLLLPGQKYQEIITLLKEYDGSYSGCKSIMQDLFRDLPAWPEDLRVACLQQLDGKHVEVTYIELFRHMRSNNEINACKQCLDQLIKCSHNEDIKEKLCLHLMCFNHMELCDYLIAKGASLAKQQTDGVSFAQEMLLNSSQHAPSEIKESWLKQQGFSISELLNTKNKDGRPLFFKFMDLDIGHLVLHGADFTLCDGDGNNFLMHILHFKSYLRSDQERFLCRDSFLKMKNNKGQSALDIAIGQCCRQGVTDCRVPRRRDETMYFVPVNRTFESSACQTLKKYLSPAEGMLVNEYEMRHEVVRRII